MTTDNEALKQVTADDIDGFVNTVHALFKRDELGKGTKDQFNDALRSVGNDFGAGDIVDYISMTNWLSKALSEGKQPDTESANSAPRWRDAIIEKSIANECLILRIARSHTEWDVLRPESSIQLAALLDTVDEDDRACLLELYQWFCFMSTPELLRAFKEYRREVLNSSKGGDSND